MRQAEAGAAIAPAGGAVGLGEAVEDALSGRRAEMPMPVSATLEAQPGLLFLRALEAHLKRHMALVGELDGVGRQVDQDLTQVLAPPTQAAGRRRVDMGEQTQALAARPGRAGCEARSASLGMEVEIDDVDRHLAGLDLGEIEDLVDQRQQRPAGARHGAGHVALIAVELGLLHQIARCR